MEQETLKINGKALYTPKGAAREYAQIGCNFYTGCPHECEYCYLKRGAPSKQLGSNVVQLKKCFKDITDAQNCLSKELDKWMEPCKKYGIFLSFTTDPLIKETRDLTLSTIISATIRDIPVWLLTKDATFIEDNRFMDYVHDINPFYRENVHFGFTLTGRDDMEPKASTNADRIQAMRKLYYMGFSTFASIEPVIDWESTEKVIHDSLSWCYHYKLGLRSGVKRDYYDIKQSGYAIHRIVKMVEEAGQTIYLKNSTKKLLEEYEKT